MRGTAKAAPGAAQKRLVRPASDFRKMASTAYRTMSNLLQPWAAAAVAVSLAMIAMHLTDTFHPPAGIDPLVVVNGMSWSFLFAPIAIGALLLALFAYAWHNLVARGPNRGDTWSLRWW
jgi:CBS-domain-containing membrane protein